MFANFAVMNITPRQVIPKILSLKELILKICPQIGCVPFAALQKMISKRSRAPHISVFPHCEFRCDAPDLIFFHGFFLPRVQLTALGDNFHLRSARQYLTCPQRSPDGWHLMMPCSSRLAFLHSVIPRRLRSVSFERRTCRRGYSSPGSSARSGPPWAPCRCGHGTHFR